LPRARRRERHAQAAAFLEEATGEIPAAASALAQHWREAGEPDRAVASYLSAAEQANRGWAKDEAAALFQEALALLPEARVDERRDIMRRQAVALASVFHADELRLRRGALSPD
jgi:hypothetical protein